MAGYPDNLDEIYTLARETLTKPTVRSYIAEQERQGLTRAQSRRYNNVPVIAFIGHGRCGKDTAASWLAANYQMEYGGSNSKLVAPIIAEAVHKSADVVYATRHDNRDFWFNFCNALREHDPTLLIRLTLGSSDAVAGIRGAAELEAALARNLIDLVVWIEKLNGPCDPTMVELQADAAHIIIENNGSLVQFYQRLRTLADLLRISERKPSRS